MTNEKSKGGREERKAMRTYLRRLIKAEEDGCGDGRLGYLVALNTVLGWVLGRQKRYDAKEGGL
jgi:hypothetical protein